MEPPGAHDARLESSERAVAEALRLNAVRGDEEGASLEAAVELIRPHLATMSDRAKPTAFRILWRGGRYDEAESLGDLEQLGTIAALTDRPEELLRLLPLAAGEAGRAALARSHRLWAERAEARAASDPVTRRTRAPDGRLRLGFLSSDLRHHVVAYFAQPLFAHRDPLVDLFVYSSHRGEPDVVQQWLATRAAYRILPPDDAAAAQAIADDALDVLVDLGGITAGNRPQLMAYRAAPRQISWLGYPHSLGLSAIDDFIVDPFLAPERDGLLAERPLVLPHSFICMSPAAFPQAPQGAPTPPCARTGAVTFGTANDPYKFSPRLLDAWARIVAAVAGSRFLIVRPEVGAAGLRAAIVRAFAAHGVGPERLEFRARRGAARAAYADIDVALDTFPVTGGTTTCESLWMGAPTVSLVGEALYERLSFSILSNAGLADLAVGSLEAYVARAVELAGDTERLAELRGSLRAMITSRPLGDPRGFARDFYAAIRERVGDERGAGGEER